MPRKVGEKLSIHPCWDENPLPKDRIAVEIEPGMAFLALAIMPLPLWSWS